MTIQKPPIMEPIQPMPPAWAIWFQGLVREFTPGTVAKLPTGSLGSRGFVTDALAPVFGDPVVDGGAVAVPVYHDGSVWRVG